MINKSVVRYQAAPAACGHSVFIPVLPDHLDYSVDQIERVAQHQCKKCLAKAHRAAKLEGRVNHGS